MVTLKVRDFKKKSPRVKGYKSCRCEQGHIHHSRGEAGWCNLVEARKRTGEIKDYEIQKKVELSAYGKHIANMYVDFWITGSDGSQWVEEFKGFATEVWRLKHAFFKVQYPEVEYKVVKGIF